MSLGVGENYIILNIIQTPHSYACKSVPTERDGNGRVHKFYNFTRPGPQVIAKQPFWTLETGKILLYNLCDKLSCFPILSSSENSRYKATIRNINTSH